MPGVAQRVELIEAVYTHPLPHGAAVDRMTMPVADRRMRDVIQTHGQAKLRYEKAEAGGRRCRQRRGGARRTYPARPRTPWSVSSRSTPFPVFPSRAGISLLAEQSAEDWPRLSSEACSTK